jgi:ABC-2 type transport system permease protein
VNLAALYLDRARFEIRNVMRDRRTVTFSIILPIFLMFIFGSVFKHQTIAGTDITLSQYIVAGIVASGILYSSFQQLSIAVPEERANGTLKRIAGSPMPRSVYFVGKLAVAFFIYTLQVIILLSVGHAFYDIHLPHSAGLWFVFVWVSVLGLLSSSLLGIAFSSAAKDGRAASAMTMPVVLFFQFTSGVYFIYTNLPTWMQDVAALFPLKWMAQAMRGVFLPAAFGLHEAGGGFEFPEAAVVLALWTIASGVLCAYSFRWTAAEGD